MELQKKKGIDSRNLEDMFSWFASQLNASRVVSFYLAPTLDFAKELEILMNPNPLLALSYLISLNLCFSESSRLFICVSRSPCVETAGVAVTPAGRKPRAFSPPSPFPQFPGPFGSSSASGSGNEGNSFWD